jgi:hypothetical protein
MKQQRRAFPFRWVLPLTQLLVCLVFLWPSRNFFLFELSQSIASYAPVHAKSGASNAVQIDIPGLTPRQQQEADRTANIEYLRMRAPVVLDFPVAIAQVPYMLANPAKREWTPRGMLPETWRAISWPFAGILFWWCAGRGIEALRAARRSVTCPRVTLVETTFAVVLFCIGLVTLVGIITSTPDDRRDVQFLALIAGGLLWGILSTFTITARVSQRRIRKGGVVASSLA